MAGFSEMATCAISEAAVISDFTGARAAELKELVAGLDRAEAVKAGEPSASAVDGMIKPVWNEIEEMWCPNSWLPDFPLPLPSRASSGT